MKASETEEDARTWREGASFREISRPDDPLTSTYRSHKTFLVGIEY